MALQIHHPLRERHSLFVPSVSDNDRIACQLAYCWTLIAFATVVLVAFAQPAVAQNSIQFPHMKTLTLGIFTFFFAFAFCLQASSHVARNEHTPTRTRTGNQDQDDKSDGNQLLDGCRVTINEMDDLDSAPTAFDAYRSGQCIGLIDGVTYASPTVCPGNRIRNSQLYRVVYKYLQDHPDELHLRDALLVRKALTEAFPCDK